MKESQPLYSQLMETFLEKIQSGDWALDTMIPSERILSEQFQVSRITVRAAIDELVRRGMLEKVHGKGTLVINRTIIQNLGGIYGFTNEMKKQGRIISADVIDREVIVPNKEVAEVLRLKENEQVVYLERLRYDERYNPIILEKAYFPLEKYRFLLEEDLEGNSLYDLLERRYGIVYDHAVERFKLCTLTSEEATLLRVKKTEPRYGMLVRRVSYMGNNIESFSTLVTNGDIMEFTITLNK